VPGPVDATLEARIDAALRSRRPVLEQLVREHVDQALGGLVDDLVAAELDRRANSNGAMPAAPVRLCRICGERSRDRGRTVCSRCRERERRERRAQAAQDSPAGDESRPAGPDAAAAAPHGLTAAELLERVEQPPARLTARELERWLLAGGLADKRNGTPSALVATRYGLEVAAAIAP